jgi:hypothetical protein
LMRFRSHYPAFEGRFELNSSSDSCVVMAWRHADHYCRLSVDLQLKQAQIDYRDVEAGCERQLLC